MEKKGRCIISHTTTAVRPCQLQDLPSFEQVVLRFPIEGVDYTCHHCSRRRLCVVNEREEGLNPAAVASATRAWQSRPFPGAAREVLRFSRSPGAAPPATRTVEEVEEPTLL